MEYNSRADMLLALAKGLEEKLNDANDGIQSLRRENEGLKEEVKTYLLRVKELYAAR